MKVKRGLPAGFLAGAALFLVTVLQSASPVYGQRLMFGGTAGGQIISTFASPPPPTGVDENRFVFGALIEAHLPGPFSIEGQGLYKSKLDYVESFSGVISTGQMETLNVNATAHGWEIPVILKWHVRPASNGLFVGGGFAARNIAGSRHVVGATSGGGLPPTTIDYIDNQFLVPNPWTFGGVVTFGVDIRAGLFHFQPEIRYTRWNDTPLLFPSRLNSVEALLSVAVGRNKG